MKIIDLFTYEFCIYFAKKKKKLIPDLVLVSHTLHALFYMIDGFILHIQV